MNVNFAHLHLLLNHFPIIGTIVGLALFLVSFVGNNQDLRRAAYLVFAGIALLTIPTFSERLWRCCWESRESPASRTPCSPGTRARPCSPCGLCSPPAPFL